MAWIKQKIKDLLRRRRDKTPPELKAVRKAVETACGDKAKVFDIDLTRDGERIYGAAAYGNGVLYRAYNGGETQQIPVKGMKDVRYIVNVGCASVEYTDENDREHEFCRAGMSNSAAMQRCVKEAKCFIDGTEPGEPEKTRCEKCGKQFPHGSQVCPYCVDKRRLYSRILPYAKPYKALLVGIVLLLITGTAINMILPKINALIVNDYLADGAISENTLDIKVKYLLLVLSMAACGLATAFVASFRRRFATRAGNGVLIDIRKALYNKIQQLSLGSVLRRSAGELITRITSDTAALQEFLTSTLPDLIQQIAIIVGVGGIMFFTDWKLTLLVLVPVPALAILFRSVRRFTHKMYNRQWNVESEAGSLLHDVFSGIRVVKVFGTEKHEEARFNRAAKRVADISKRNELTWNLITPFVNFLFTFGEYAAIIFVGSNIINHVSGYNLGTLIEFTSYVTIIYGPIRWMAFMPRRIARTTVSLTKVFEILDEKPEISDAEAPLQEVGEGNIEFRDASFGYNTYENVLKNISLTVNKGEMIGIVGRSGVGKTTLINLVMRLYDVTGGELLIDGKNIKDYSQHALRSQIGVVLQETFLFKGTIYTNIIYTKPNATKEEVIRASKLAGAHDFIMKQPDGYDTYVGEGGYTLSGGERQRIAIARAILKNPRILILDEATSALDTETEKQIQDALAKLISGRTTIAIAHRLSTLRNATKLVVLEKGCVEEIGTHDELMANKGRYYKLVMAQRSMSKMAGEISE